MLGILSAGRESLARVFIRLKFVFLTLPSLERVLAAIGHVGMNDGRGFWTTIGSADHEFVIET